MKLEDVVEERVLGQQDAAAFEYLTAQGLEIRLLPYNKTIFCYCEVYDGAEPDYVDDRTLDMIQSVMEKADWVFAGLKWKTDKQIGVVFRKRLPLEDD